MVSYHVAFLPFPAYGHVNPCLPVAAELVRRGHRVTFATDGRFAPAVAGTGARVLEYESWLASRDLPDHLDAEYLVHEPVRSIDEAIATVPVYEDGFGEDLPDVLLYDVSTFAAGRVLARKWKRPAIELYETLASNGHYSLNQEIGAMYASEIDPAHPALVDFFVKQARLLQDHGLAGVTMEEFLAPAEEVNLVFLPRRFQQAQETFDESFAFVGACIGERAGEPDWSPSGDGRPVLLVSMGSFSYEHQQQFVRTCLEAFAGTPWHVVISVGTKVDVDKLGPVPENFELLRWVPQLQVLERAAAFVTHAGANSVMEAMYFGTPVVAVPHTPEQRLIAARVAELGLGVHVPEEEVTAERLRAAVAGLAADEKVRGQVELIRGEMRAVDGPSLAADVIEARARNQDGTG